MIAPGSNQYRIHNQFYKYTESVAASSVTIPYGRGKPAHVAFSWERSLLLSSVRPKPRKEKMVLDEMTYLYKWGNATLPRRVISNQLQPFIKASMQTSSSISISASLPICLRS